VSDVGGKTAGRIPPVRLVIGGAGIALGLFGVFRLVTQIPAVDLFVLLVWLLGALVIHDGILSPVVVGIGALLERYVPARARTYLQAALVAGALVTVIALPMIDRQDSQPAGKAILRQNFSANLGILVGVIAAVSLLLYAIRLVRDRQAASATKDRPPQAHESVRS
jgi:hypothetical protein